MEIKVLKNPAELGEAAGNRAAGLIKQSIKEKGNANVIVATGTSQFETLRQLAQDRSIDWSKVVMFHLDEYIGLPSTHPASFRKYLKERFLSHVSPLKATHLVNGEADPIVECKRLGDLISAHPIDVALVGIGENGHLAFNDPPADFDTDTPYLVVTLDDLCVQQQFGEGWFSSLEEVPRKAISMSVKQIMKATHILCSVPDKRKATAVRDCLENKISNLHPASILQRHERCTIYLDEFSASLLPSRVKV